MRTSSRVLTLSLAAALAGPLSACDDKSPTAPRSPVTPPTPTPTLTRLEIVGPRSVPPGETVQFAVTGHLSDGSTRDMASQATWQSQSASVLSIDDSGRATGRQLGESVITARVASMTSTTEIVVVPAGTYRLAVIAREAGSIFLGVRVDVLQGTAAGLSSTQLINGRYPLYGVSGDTLIRVSGRGYKDHTQRVFVTEHTVIEVEMVPERARIQISGAYTLTITADPARCGALPEELRVRRYTTQVTQLGPEVWVTLVSGSAPAGSLVGNRFGGRLDEDNMKVAFSLALNIRYGYYYYYGDTFSSPPDVAERLSGTTYLLISGGVDASISERSLSGTLRGLIQTVEMPVLWKVTRWGEHCNSGHAFELTR